MDYLVSPTTFKIIWFFSELLRARIVWGFGESSTTTTLLINNRVYSTVSAREPANAQKESIWSVTLDPVSDEGPFDIHVQQPVANGTLMTITLHDVLFGDVWICSGQSNMEANGKYDL